MSIFIIGGTGLTGAEFVKHAQNASAISNITTLGRRTIEGAKINSIVESDTSKWAKIIKENGKESSAFFSAFGTTRAQAGGLENFKKIDIDVNIDAAKAAKEAGIETYVLVSSGAASSGSMVPYLKLKGQLEDEVIALKFKNTIILRPGVLLGDRTSNKGFLNNLGVYLGKATKNIWYGLLSPTEASDVAKVGLSLVLKTGSESKGVQILEAAEITKLAKEL